MDSKKFYWDILNSMSTMIAVLEPCGKIMFVNKISLDRINSKLDIMGKMFYDGFWWQYSDEVPQLIKNDIAQCSRKKNIAKNIQVNTKNRGLIWINFHLTPVLDSHGEVEYLVAEGMDITERKKVQVELRNQKKFLNHLVDSVPGIMYAFDDEGRFLRWNKNFEKVTGCSALELESKKFLDFFKGDNQAVVQEGINEVFQDNQATREAEITSMTGRKTPYFLTGNKIEF